MSLEPEVTTGAELARQLNPWDEQPGESHVVYQYFKAFRDMPSYARNLAGLAESYGLDPNTMRRHCFQNKWQERVRAYDAYMDGIKQRAYEQEIENMSARQARQAIMFQNALALPAEELMRRIGEDETTIQEVDLIDLLNTVPRSANAWKQVALLERLARGQTTESIQTENGGAIEHIIRAGDDISTVDYLRSLARIANGNEGGDSAADE